MLTETLLPAEPAALPSRAQPFTPHTAASAAHVLPSSKGGECDSLGTAQPHSQHKRGRQAGRRAGGALQLTCATPTTSHTSDRSDIGQR
jgi:hypothetical protein